MYFSTANVILGSYPPAVAVTRNKPLSYFLMIFNRRIGLNLFTGCAFWILVSCHIQGSSCWYINPAILFPAWTLYYPWTYWCSCAWRLHPKTRKQGKGMLEVPWLPVELREWFAVTRSTFLWSFFSSIILYPQLQKIVRCPSRRRRLWLGEQAWRWQ